MAGLSRREFLFLGAAAGAGVGAGVVLPLTRLVNGDPTPATDGIPAAVAQFFPRTRIAGVSELTVGSPLLFDYPNQGQSSMLVRMGVPAETGLGPDQDIVAYSRVCTHMGCVINQYQADHTTLGPCPCHYTTFDFSTGGQVILGQATQNLPQVLLEVDGDDIFAVGVARLVYGYNDTLGLEAAGVSA